MTNPGHCCPHRQPAPRGRLCRAAEPSAAYVLSLLALLFSGSTSLRCSFVWWWIPMMPSVQVSGSISSHLITTCCDTSLRHEVRPTKATERRQHLSTNTRGNVIALCSESGGERRTGSVAYTYAAHQRPGISLVVVLPAGLNGVQAGVCPPARRSSRRRGASANNRLRMCVLLW
jgi:hypothetical protein